MIKRLLPTPAIGRSVAVFGLFYVFVLIVAVPIARYFSFDGLSAICWGALIASAVLVGEGWKAHDAIFSMKKGHGGSSLDN